MSTQPALPPEVREAVYEAVTDLKLERWFGDKQSEEMRDMLIGSLTGALAPHLEERSQRIRQLLSENARWRAQAEQKLALRREIEDALNIKTGEASDEALAKGVEAIRALKARAEAAEAKLAKLETTLEAELQAHAGDAVTIAQLRAGRAVAEAARDDYHRKACDIADQRDRAEEQLADAREDSERLDWLQSDTPEVGDVLTYFQVYENVDLRAAIDAARQKEDSR